MFDVVVIGAGPAGLQAALRAGELGARTALVSDGPIGGMGANDGPVPVRTLAHAARLVREARQMPLYGIDVGTPRADFPRLLERVRAVVEEVQRSVGMREQLESQGVVIHEHAGRARFESPHAITTERGLRLESRHFILCTGGRSRQLPFPGTELTATHSDAWSLKAVPESMVVVGAGATGIQVASIFNAFGCRVSLFEAAPRILMTEDEDVSVAVRDAFREQGVEVVEGFGRIEAVEPRDGGVRFRFRSGDVSSARDVSGVVMAVGWVANVEDMHLEVAGVATDARGYVRVDPYLRTSAPHIFAAGDINGRLMLVPNALQEGYFAGTNAVAGARFPLPSGPVPVGSFTDPEYASVGLTETQARKEHDCVVGLVPFDKYPRCIIDGHTQGFCKLVVDRDTRRILGAHVVGERAVETIQMAAVGMAADITVDMLENLALSFPTYVASLGRAAFLAVRELGPPGVPTAHTWEPHAWAMH
jgi:pyruvate/2-oxoglutarate dehydrogenase complex dihydrolipoamide dehydrogenase (E3) component